MYERLQSEICQRVVIELRKRKVLHNNVEEYVDLEYYLFLSDHEGLPKAIYDIFKHERIQKEIHERILEEICILTPKLEKRHSELVTQIRQYEQSHDIFHGNGWNVFDFYLFGSSFFESLQEEALSYELILDKLRHGSSIETEMYQRVIDALHRTALTQFVHWKNTHQDISKLQYQLSTCHSTGKYPSVILNALINPSYQISELKPLPKLQYKYSIRQLKKFRS
ncbi:unnamed protein product [Rotaria sp. Silwood1]|nr:unnamed protein product [Rotaria sp. Silwood1]